MSTNEFSFNLFYVKRIKRILPLFYLVVCTSLIFSYWLHTPNDFANFADSWRYASSFIANIYFEKHSGYFAPTSETLPLLHTWSLSIEEQFYFVWPVVLIISARYLSKSTLATFIILSLVGLVGYSQFLTVADPEKGYYFIQSRAFELLIGGLLAILSANKSPKDFLPSYFFNLFGITGLVVVISLAWILNESDSFPGINALWVVLSACLIILSGENQRSIVSRILSIRPIVFMGRLSYSLYLWHWPVLAFYRYYYTEFTVLDAVLCGFITLALSVVSWRFFETRLRHLPMKKHWVYLFYLVLPIVLSVTLAKNIARNEGYPERFPISAIELYNQSTSSFDKQKQSLPQVDGYQPFEPYVIGDSSKPISSFIWGDSHGAHYRAFIDEMGKKEEFSALYGGIGGCPPLLGVDLLKYGEPESGCTNVNQELVEVIERKRPKSVYVAARWAMYAETTRSPGEKGSRVFLGDTSDYSESVANSRRALELGLRNTIKRLLESNVTPVILEQVPDYSFKPSCVFR
ncbi:acyltransferase family protein [Vibrio sp. Hal054]